MKKKLCQLREEATARGKKERQERAGIFKEFPQLEPGCLTNGRTRIWMPIQNLRRKAQGLRRSEANT